MTVTIRNEQPADVAAIDRVVEEAFGQRDEADLVVELRREKAVLVSLVALIGEQVVGHIAFTRAEIVGAECTWPVAALAPVAVLPDSQRGGIGIALVEQGIVACRALPMPAILVLGHPEYYPRFGFTPASQVRVECPWPAPDEAFLALELETGFFAEVAGTLRYHSCFDRFA